MKRRTPRRLPRAASALLAAAALSGPTALLVPAAAHAQDNGIFIGVGAVDASADHDTRLAPFRNYDSDTSGFKLIGGIRPLDRLGIEVNYVSPGEMDVRLPPVACPAVVGYPCPESDELSLQSRMVSVSAVGYFTVPFVDLYGRLGMARWATELEASGLEETERGTDPTFGAGVQLRLGGLGLRLEYERFELADDSTDTVSLGFTYTFF